LSDQIGVKITFKGSDNSLKVQKNYFCNGTLERAKLERTYLIEANLEGANLQGANLIGAKLARAKFERAKLERAKLERAKLERAYLIEANLEGAYLIERLSNSDFDLKTYSFFRYCLSTQINPYIYIKIVENISFCE
jgi:uncharacterized protein YjbI with pentapeptide repeats